MKKHSMMFRRIVDIGMTILLLCLMAYQITGAALHEWIGMAMTVLVVVHQVLNRRWYGALQKGKYNAYRLSQTIVNVLLMGSFVLTAVCGMAMSAHAVSFLYGILPVADARILHLSMSHWSFVLMGIHLGLHIPMMISKWKLLDQAKMILSLVFCIIAGYGLYLFLKAGMIDYLLFRTVFAFLDYEKSALMVFLGHICMLIFWAFMGTQFANICRNTTRKVIAGKKKWLPACFMIIAVVLGLVFHTVLPKVNTQGFTAQETNTNQDDYILITGGTFMMESPDTENWRIEDETQHEVTLSSFYIDPYETTQKEYERLMGTNPGTFQGELLPIENVTWFDAIRYANAKSEDAGLTPVYTITDEGVSWDMSGDGYRLPTEAEWEYDCRAGTTTPFNTEKSLDATEANFYGHYPYEIEENCFDNSDLEAKS